MRNQYGIPDDELKQFKSHLRVYSIGEKIINEGETDHRIFLLRKGQVDVYKNIASEQQFLSSIQAVNFFGEMAIVSHRPRTASVIAATDPVVVYEFENPNLSTIMAHPTWGMMLLKRLADNLEERHRAYESAQVEMKNLKTEIGDMLGALVSFSSAAKKDESTFSMLPDILLKLIKLHLRNQAIQLNFPNREQAYIYYKLGILPEKMYQIAIDSADESLEDSSS